MLEQDLFLVGGILPEEQSECLSLEDWDRIFRIVNKHVLLQSEFIVGQNMQMRLEILKQDRRQSGKETEYSDTYRALAVQTAESKEALEEKILKHVCDHLNLDISIYFQSIEHLINYQNFEDFKKQTEKEFNSFKNSIDGGRKSVSKMKGLEIYLDVLKLQQHLLTQINTMPDEQVLQETKVLNIFVDDHRQIKYGVSETQYDHFIATHNLKSNHQAEQLLDQITALEESLNEKMVNMQY